jgi:glycerophosphoryl diester phosphodiesterase
MGLIHKLFMRKIIILMVWQVMVIQSYCAAQTNGQANVYLTGYTWNKNTPTIGYVKIRTGTIKSVTLGGESQAAFKVSKDHQVLVRPEKLKAGTTYADISVTVKTTSGEETCTFRIVKDDFIRNKVIAHRGAWKNTGATENSIAALNHAIALGCEGSEFDVHMSADSLPVINHDASIQGVSIAKTNSSELLTMKLSNGELLPTLENYLRAGMVQNKTKLILEIKPSELGKESSLALTNKIVSLVEKLHAEAWVDYISFDYDVCKEVMKLAPYARAAYLKGDKTPADLAADNLYGLDYHVSVLQKNPDWLTDAKNRKLTVNVWTVNDKTVLEELLKQNVDFITTNEPELLLSMVKR